MKKSFVIFGLWMAFSLLPLVALAAKEETQAVAAPKCDLEKVKKAAGKALIKAEKGSWEGGYNVTLDTEKMTFSELLQKLAKEKCL